MSDRPDTARIDKWLWVARFFRTRGIATQVVQNGGVRLNGDRVTKPGRSVAVGDVLTFSQGRQVRVVRIEAVAARRGPAPEAQALYTDLSPDPAPRQAAPSRNDRRRSAEAKRRPLE